MMGRLGVCAGDRSQRPSFPSIHPLFVDQMGLLTYHYFKVEELYKPARLMVASYVLLTAFGNTVQAHRGGCGPVAGCGLS